MGANEIFGWVWVLGGLLSGLILGLFFHHDGWLGGYASFRRRLLRLGHISFIGLGILNILFSSAAPRLHLDPLWLSVASNAMIIGGVTMPVCCALITGNRSLQPAFAVPVASLVLGVALVVLGMLRP